jgi:glucose/arabinose dehydrogenase
VSISIDNVKLIEANGETERPPAELTPERLAKMKVETLYASLCAQCHGERLAGGLAPSFLDGEWKHGGSDADIARTITKGNLEFGMTPWEHVLTKNQIHAMVVFLREKELEALNKGIVFPRPELGKVTKTDRAEYKIEVVVDEGIKKAWAIAFLPDGRKLVTEHAGNLRLIGTDGKLHPEPIKGTPEVIQHGQGGLMEVAVHPNYATNGWIYLGFADGWWEKSEGKKDKAHTINAVVRGRIKDHAWVDQEWVWKAEKKFYGDEAYHFGTRIVFDQGYIYFVVGERGGMKQVQELTNPKGKIFRLFDDGREPEDNPFVNTPGAMKGIWSYGHRNAQGLAIDPRDGTIYSTEHGPRGGDELNLILKGHNYGWPIITHGMNYDGTPMTPDSKTHEDGMDQPITYWTPSIATSGLDFYDGDRFPGWRNDLFVGALKQKEIRRLRIIDGKVTEQEIILKGLGRVRDVATSLDGYLYVILDGPDHILRLTPPND